MKNSQHYIARWKIFTVAAAFVVLLLMCVGYNSLSEKITQQDIANDFAQIALQKETMSLRMEHATEVAEAWIAQSSDSKGTEASLKKIYNEIVEEYDALDNYELSDEMKQALEKYGIDSVDYVAMADERIDDLYNDELSVEYMLAYLELGDQDGMKRYLDMQKSIIKAENEYNAWAINYLFCGWSGDALDYVQENIVDKLAEEHQLSVWLTERNEVEEQAAECLDRMEEVVTEQQLQLEKDKLALEIEQ